MKFFVVRAITIGVLLSMLLIACGGEEESLPHPPVPDQDGIAFYADRISFKPGECTFLRWEVSEGIGVALDGENVPKIGDAKVCPAETTSYELVVDVGTYQEIRRIDIIISEGAAEQPLDGQELPPVIPGNPAYETREWKATGGPPGGFLI